MVQRLRWTGLRRGDQRRVRAPRRSLHVELLEPRIALSGDGVVTLPGVSPEWTVYPQGREYLPIYTDPGDRLVNTDVLGDGVPLVLGEWEVDDQLGGWTVNSALSHSVAGGVLSAEFFPNSASELQLTLSNISPEPVLDYGFNDFVQLRMKLPAGYDQDVTFSYGTTTRDGFSAARQFVLPAAEIPTDGQWHEYRIDLGLEVYWRDRLDDLQIEIPDTGEFGLFVEIDYVEIGDQPGDVLLINDNLNIVNTIINSVAELERIESKHFATWWSPAVEAAKPNPGDRFNPATDGLRALRMLEESYQVYAKVLGYIEPFYGPNTPEPLLDREATLDYFDELPSQSVHNEYALSAAFSIDGQPLEIVGTLDGVVNGSDARIYRNPVGVFPVSANHGTNQDGDANTWLANEDFEFRYQILDGGADVTSQYEVSVTGVTAEWRNTSQPSFGVIFGSDQAMPFGQIDFSGASTGWQTATVEPAMPIDITSGSGGFRIDLAPTFDDHFRFRDIQLEIVPVGDTGSGGGYTAPSPLPDYSLPRYKTNHITWYDGYWMSALGGYTYFNVGESGLRDEGWGNPVPHEFGHAVDGAQPGFLVGGHWESHANYLRENWTGHFAPLFPQNEQSHLSLRVLINSNFHQDHKRFIYQDYRIHFALQDYATQLGLHPNAAAQLWQVGEENESVYEKLASILPQGVSIADVIGETMRYWPVLDFVNGQLMKDNLWTTPDEKAMYDYQLGSLLIPSADRPGWHRVPLERAPEKFAYMFHELIPSDSMITVEFQGIDVLGDQEDWRWSLVAIDSAGNARYSDVWSPGMQSFELLPDEDRVLLVVVATPDDTSLDLESYYNSKPSDKHIDRLRYPYEVRIVGAEQASKQLDWNSASGSYHSNPDGSTGGWVANSAFVAASAYVGPNARVLGTSRVEGNARVEDYAVVAVNARVRGSAVVSGYAAVIDNAIVEGDARVRDRALIKNTAKIRGDAVVEDYAIVTEGVQIIDSAIARGSSEAFSNGSVISGTAILDYDYSMGWQVNDGVHQNHIAFGGWFDEFYAQTVRKPRGLIASYRVEAPDGAVLWDEFGAQHAILRGVPFRVTDYAATGEVLRLNGSDQYVVLDRSLFDLRDATFGVWLKPASAAAGQTLLYGGSSAGDYLELIARNDLGQPVLTISVDGIVHQIVADQSVAVNEWSHVAFTFGGGLMTLYVNGIVAGQTATTLTPSDVLGPNDYRSSESLYVGRSAAGESFYGSVDDIRFYNVTRSADEIVDEMQRRGAILGAFYTDAPMIFNGTSTTDESGVRNGLQRTLIATIKPESSGNVSYYEAVFDSNDERSGMQGTGFGLDNGEFVVRLDGLGFWHTGVQAVIGQWQQVRVAFNGSEAYLYVNGVQAAARSYSANPDNLAGKNYRIGFGQADNDSLSYFHGEIRDAMIFDRAILPDAARFGDYNEDGIVDAADYTRWRDTLGQTVAAGTAADGDASGVIDQGDYVVWIQNFGRTMFASAGGATSIAVHEPLTEVEIGQANRETAFEQLHGSDDPPPRPPANRLEAADSGRAATVAGGQRLAIDVALAGLSSRSVGTRPQLMSQPTARGLSAVSTSNDKVLMLLLTPDAPLQSAISEMVEDKGPATDGAIARHEIVTDSALVDPAFDAWPDERDVIQLLGIGAS